MVVVRSVCGMYCSAEARVLDPCGFLLCTVVVDKRKSITEDDFLGVVDYSNAEIGLLFLIHQPCGVAVQFKGDVWPDRVLPCKLPVITARSVRAGL